jgi:hypothetical protein
LFSGLLAASQRICGSPGPAQIQSFCERWLGRLPVPLDGFDEVARAINHPLLDTERVGQGCVLASPAFARVAHSTIE